MCIQYQKEIFSKIELKKRQLVKLVASTLGETKKHIRNSPQQGWFENVETNTYKKCKKTYFITAFKPMHIQHKTSELIFFTITSNGACETITDYNYYFVQCSHSES